MFLIFLFFLFFLYYNPDIVINKKFYNDDYEEYKNTKEENITDLVCI